MIAAGIGARDRAAGKTAKTVRHQPFITAGAVPNAASIAAEDQKCDLFSKGAPLKPYRETLVTSAAEVRCPGATELIGRILAKSGSVY